MTTNDTVIVSGLVPNYEAGDLLAAAVAINGGKITQVVPSTDEQAVADLAANASEVIDAKGHVVAPGFIDIHMHEEDLDDTKEYAIGRLMARMGVTTGICGNCGESPQPIEKFRSWVESQGGAPMNYVVLAGYNDYRRLQGPGPYDGATEEQQQAARKLVREQIEAGCWGVSFGLEYDPGITTEEMHAALAQIRDLDPFVSIHFRADCEDAPDSIREMAELSRAAGVRVEVSHLSSLAGYGYMDEALELIEAEHAANPRFTYDTYPYTAFSTGIGTAVFDVDWRTKWGCDYDAIQFLYPPYRGQRATKETYEQVRREHPEQNVVCFAMRAEEISAALANPLGLVCSDGGVYEGECHPRAAGTFPRFLGRYVRDEKIMGLVEALEKITLKPAQRIGLDGCKGTVEVGKDADLVIFDPQEICDRSTFDDPAVPPVGIDRVMVAGRSVVVDGHDTDELPGGILDRADHIG